MNNLAETMTVISIREPGGPEVLETATLPVPQAGDGQVLIKVAAAGVNRPDVLQRLGGYPPPPGAPLTPGLEVAGEIVVCGNNVSRWTVGDRVCALVSGGGYGEYVVADAGHCLPVPIGFSLEQAAALPETVFTVWHNVFQRGALGSGETLLVHGGTSGIGTVTIQLAKALGAMVIATAGSSAKCEACVKLGADTAINYREEDYVTRVKEVTDGRGADVILDMVGGEYIQRNIKCAAADGRIVQIAFLGGSKAEVDFTQLMLKRLILTGSTLRARSSEFKQALAQEVRDNVWPMIEEGKFAPVMHASFPLAEASAAHAMMEESQHIGKIVLTV